jgi:hypothetical protein
MSEADDMRSLYGDERELAVFHRKFFTVLDR